MFRPRSIAIIGASDDPVSLSGRPLQVLRQHAYDGEIYLVNPKPRPVTTGNECDVDALEVAAIYRTSPR